MTELEEFLIGLLKVITVGCRRHVYYQGNSPPKVTDCNGCREMFKAKQKWRKFLELNEKEIE